MPEIQKVASVPSVIDAVDANTRFGSSYEMKGLALLFHAAGFIASC